MYGTIGLNTFAKLVRISFVIVVAALISRVNPRFADAQQLPSPPPYQQLRYEEDYSYLRDPTRRTDLWDIIKYIPFNDKGDWNLSVGGEVRERYEYFHNSLWGQGPQDKNGYLLQRYMLHADLHFGPNFRFFGQLKSGLEGGRNGGPRPSDEDKLDINQAFLDGVLGFSDDASLTLRAGRQEMAYGSSRLVSFREGPNVRQSFDGLRMTLNTGAWRVDGFVTRPVETDPGFFDDGPDHTRAFWGGYAVRPLPVLPKGNIDLYYLGLLRKEAEFDQGTVRELRHSVGMRLWSRTQAWDYNFEFVYQWGRFGGGRIQAWTIASDTGYTVRSTLFSPRIGLKANIASGDRDPNEQDLQTFNALFPRGAYFSEASLIGPANFMDLHPSLDLHLTERVTLTTDWDFFWRQSVRDGIYGNAVNLVRSGQGSRARYIGSQPQTQVEWRANRHLTFTAVYAHFFAGPFLKETRPGKDVDYFTAWATYKF
jgi:hypothetical protein